MSWTLLLACIWVVLMSVLALMPFPQHKSYALAMLVVLPFSLIAITLEHGALWALGLFFCAASIYRYPLMYLLRRSGGMLRGQA